MATHSKTQRHGRLMPRAEAEAFFDAHGFTPAPELVQWMTTLRCPLSCEHCLAAAEGTVGDELSLDEAASLIEQVAGLGVDEFLLTGGEPLARRDLPEVIGVLRANGVRWSLNTAAMPGRELRRAIDAWPPSFVAVSLDGPEVVHDAFRGRDGAFRDATASLSYFAGIVPDGVTAGTTVTARNFAHLPETFATVIESAATAWGLHLLVPEGRAAGRPDLFLSREQLKRLIRFAAAKRRHFPVTLADEIGYCGFWEPLVREAPFFCGAGRAQCVVLPDGEVVPCTTLDRSTSAGSIRERSLADIWRDGFAELREWVPEEKCEACRYAVACRGGCWLQRRHGTECFRDVWHVPRAVTAAGMAVCLGLGASGVMMAEPARAAEAAAPAPVREIDGSKMQVLQRSIIQWYAARSGGRRSPSESDVRLVLEKELPDDPGAQYFLAFVNGQRSENVVERTKAIDAALATQQRSLCLIDVAWRDLMEWCMDSGRVQDRTPAQQRVVREAMTRLSITAEAWRKEIFEKKLDPFLRRSGHYRRYFMSKAGPRPHELLERDIATKRGWTNEDLTTSFLEEHPYAETMRLHFTSTGELKRLVRGEEMPVDGSMDVFDLLIVPEQDAAPMLVLDAGGRELTLFLPPGSELTYADVLQLAFEQNRDAVYQVAGDVSASRRVGVSPVALPALREMLEQIEAQDATKERDRALYSLRWRLADLYLF